MDLYVPARTFDQQTVAFIDNIAPDPEIERASPPSSQSAHCVLVWQHSKPMETDLPARLQLCVQISNLIKTAKEHMRRRDFLLGFGSSPVDFINGLIASQARDLRAMQKAGTQPTPLALRRTHFFEGKYVSIPAKRNGKASSNTQLICVSQARADRDSVRRWVEDAVLRYLHRRLAAGA